MKELQEIIDNRKDVLQKLNNEYSKFDNKDSYAARLAYSYIYDLINLISALERVLKIMSSERQLELVIFGKR